MLLYGQVTLISERPSGVYRPNLLSVPNAVPAGCLRLCTNLVQVSSIRQAHASASDERRRQYFDAFFCFGLPIIYMVLYFIVQNHRFDIIENYGCRPTVYYSIPSLSIPPIVVEIMSLGYAAFAVRSFMVHC